MNKELAQQLKDAGFPYSEMARKVLQDFPNHTLEPMLSELIETCGKEFGFLRGHKDYWIAEGGNSTQRDGYMNQGQGKTPEEAVARLWLKLSTLHNAERSV